MTHGLLTRRTLLAGAAASVVAACVQPPRGPAGASRLRLIGQRELPHRLAFQGTTVGGLSAIDFDAASGTWVALSDDRSEIDAARFYTLRIDFDAKQLAPVQLLQAITLRQANGQPYPDAKQGGDVPDPEAARLLPGARGLLWTSEGDGKRRLQPFLREARMDGGHVRDYPLPAMLQFGGAPGTGPRNNLTLEGLALTPDGRHAWVAMEAALQQDGPVPTPGAPGAPCRFTLIDLASGRALRQIAYAPDAVPMQPIPPGAYSDNGVSEILMADAQRMLVLERAYALGRGTSIRLYEIDTTQADDTLGFERLPAGQFRAAAKTLVADFATLGLPRLDNTEGLCWGPRLAHGARSLVFVSDDNFNPLQVTQFVACEYLE
jgi:hypothetical protein